MQKLQNKNEKILQAFMVGILLYSKIEKKKKKKTFFSDFYNQGRSDLDKQTAFFLGLKVECTCEQLFSVWKLLTEIFAHFLEKRW